MHYSWLFYDILSLPVSWSTQSGEDRAKFFVKAALYGGAVMSRDAYCGLDKVLIDELERVEACTHVTGVDGAYVK